MAKVRDSKATKNKIIKAAVKEITEHGYDATTVSGVARRARVSKQLLSHHFPTKEELFSEVHDFRTRSALLDENLPSNPADLMAERFRLRSKDVDYVRFLTWEAATGQLNHVPGRDARVSRISRRASAIRDMQLHGRIPLELDHKLLQLAITSVATYPIAFRQITHMVTGRDPTDRRFQKDWYKFLQKIGRRIFYLSGAR